MYFETCIAPVNIALIKYWGKRDEDLILPINDSLSMTLSTEELCAKTTVAASASFKCNRMWLNGEVVQFDNPRVVRCLKEVQRLALSKGGLKFPIEWSVHIVSRNNFPTAAGLASSAAGYACLVYALACLYGVEEEELSSIARQGSGSACRSLFGGFVRWCMGTLADGSDSVAIPVEPATHWPEMHVLILVVNDARKKTGSSAGMKCSVDTSDLIKYRAKYCVPERIGAIIEAIKAKDFNAFAKITMKDSNQFHAIALDTYPPCVYMNDISHAIVDFVHLYNTAQGSLKVAYTFDAGPNACLYVLEENVSAVLEAIQFCFPNDRNGNVEYIKGIPVDLSKNQDNALKYGTFLQVHEKNLLKYVIHTKIGSGPQKLGKDSNMLNMVDGTPIDSD